MIRPVLALAVSVALGGCGSMSGLGGSSEFACQAPEGVVCTSVSGVYATSLAGALPAQRESGGARAEPEREGGGSRTPPGGMPRAWQASPYAAAGAPAAGEPLLSPPRVMRLWIAPYTDDDGDLRGDSYVYVLWDRGEWRLPHTQAQIRKRFAPVSRIGGPQAPAPKAVARQEDGAEAPSAEREQTDAR